MTFLLSVVGFVLTLGLLIVIHEYGHYRVAVACGVKVLRFSVGFGRVLWRRQPKPDGTEFTLCALPLGGYVRMLDEREGAVAPAELDRAFNRQSLAKRAAIVSAGPISNLVLAVLLYTVVHWIGSYEEKAVLTAPVAGSLAAQAGMRAGDWVHAASTGNDEWHDLASIVSLRWDMTQALMAGKPLELKVSSRDGANARRVTLPLDTLADSEIDAKLLQRVGLGTAYREPVISMITPGGAAEAAGLRVKDRILGIDGTPIGEAGAVRDLTRASGRSGKAVPMRWHLERDGRDLDLTVTAKVESEGTGHVGLLGINPGTAETVFVRDGIVEGFTNAVSQTWQTSAMSLKTLGKMLIGKASLKNLSGPITIAEYAGASLQLGVVVFLGYLALISVSLGVLNLLPLPVLDGGHLMYYLFEAVTGKPVSERWLDRLQRGGVAIMLMMMSLALYNDMARVLGPQ